MAIPLVILLLQTLVIILHGMLLRRVAGVAIVRNIITVLVSRVVVISTVTLEIVVMPAQIQAQTMCEVQNNHRTNTDRLVQLLSTSLSVP